MYFFEFCQHKLVFFHTLAGCNTHFRPCKLQLTLLANWIDIIIVNHVRTLRTKCATILLSLICGEILCNEVIIQNVWDGFFVSAIMTCKYMIALMLMHLVNGWKPYAEWNGMKWNESNKNENSFLVESMLNHQSSSVNLRTLLQPMQV